MKSIHGIFILTTLAAGVLTGCEQRVVQTRNSWVGSQIEMAEQRHPNEKKQAKSNFFDDTGEFLFGWTDALSGDDKKKKSSDSAISGNKLKDRQSQPTTSQQSGG